jgi:group I intron endonuclease
MGCIYVIENTVNGKIYVGQSVDGKRRLQDHLSTLKNNKHGNKHLQSSWNKYGSDGFTFTILVDNLPEHYMDDVERGLIATLRTMNPEYGYNKDSGGHLHKKASEETRKKQSEKWQIRLSDPCYTNPNLGKKWSPEAIEKQRQSKLNYFAKGGIHPMQGKKLPEGQIHFNSRAIIDSEGVVWPSIKSLLKCYGGAKSTFYYLLKSGKPFKGLTFKYLDETTQETQEEARYG